MKLAQYCTSLVICIIFALPAVAQSSGGGGGQLLPPFYSFVHVYDKNQDPLTIKADTQINQRCAFGIPFAPKRASIDFYKRCTELLSKYKVSRGFASSGGQSTGVFPEINNKAETVLRAYCKDTPKYSSYFTMYTNIQSKLPWPSCESAFKFTNCNNNLCECYQQGTAIQDGTTCSPWSKGGNSGSGACY